VQKGRSTGCGLHVRGDEFGVPLSGRQISRRNE